MLLVLAFLAALPTSVGSQSVRPERAIFGLAPAGAAILFASYTTEQAVSVPMLRRQDIALLQMARNWTERGPHPVAAVGTLGTLYPQTSRLERLDISKVKELRASRVPFSS